MEPRSMWTLRTAVSSRGWRCLLAVLMAVVAAVSSPRPAFAIVTSEGGFSVNNIVGANTFYNAGYTGTRSVVANVESGSVWNGHETLMSVNTFIKSPLPIFNGTQLGQYASHATSVGQTIAGQGGAEKQQGIAYGATLWSGSIATTMYFDGSFEWSNNNAFVYPYLTAMQTGVGGRKADVVNSSWGFEGSAGNDQWSVALDGMVAKNHTVFVTSAGNKGDAPNTVHSPANGFNTLNVGALAYGNDPNQYQYNQAIYFSSRSPSDVGTPAGVIPLARSAVDIAAPGEKLTLAEYGGATNDYGTMAGTSFAAPIVAGGAALVVDAGYANFNGGESIDGRVVKAVLMNSADKTLGWNNGQSVISGVVTTTQALDYSTGAGSLNLTKAFTQYLGGTTGGTGTDVAEVGWKLGTVAGNSYIDYNILPQLLGGTTFTATLTWFANRSFLSVDADGIMSTADTALSHLELQLWRDVNGIDTLIADSNALYNTSQHFSFLLGATGSYFLRVLNLGIYAEWGGGAEAEQFGLAWWGTAAPTAVPEPTSLVLGALAAPIVVLTSRRRKKCAA
jgi:subtilisin family serine protease